MAQTNSQQEARNLILELKNKQFKPVYLLHGEEPFYIDSIAKYFIDHTLDETEKDFNQTVLYGQDAELRQVDAEVRRYPMMSEKRLVVVKEAHKLKNLEKGLEAYVSKPSESTILVLAFNKKLNAAKKFYKSIKKNGVVFESKKMYETQLPEWITSYIKQKGFQAQPASVQLIADSIGLNLSTIVKEIDKLSIVLKDRGTTLITPELIEEHVGISKDFNIFEFTTSVGLKKTSKSFNILRYFAENVKDANIFQGTSVLYNFFTKVLLYHYMEVGKTDKYAVAKQLGVNPYFVSDYMNSSKLYSAQKIVNIIADLRQYDARAKGVDNVSANHYELFKELLIRIFN